MIGKREDPAVKAAKRLIKQLVKEGRIDRRVLESVRQIEDEDPAGDGSSRKVVCLGSKKGHPVSVILTVVFRGTDWQVDATEKLWVDVNNPYLIIPLPKGKYDITPA